MHSISSIAPADTVESASQAGLKYVSDSQAGIRRERSGAKFRYIDHTGKPVDDAATLNRIRALVIPPNWSDVWICRDPKGHLQATGRDSRGRKQYRYHARYRAQREQTKYEKLIVFGEMLPAIRRRVARDLALPGLPKEKVIATVVRFMDLAHIRVGNEEYVRENHSFGLTTMRNRHVEVKGPKIHFHFRGKSGKQHELDLEDKRLAVIVRHCRDLPGYELFEYIDESGAPAPLDSGMVNEYLRDTTGEDITAKIFRTWHGTVCAVEELGACCQSSGVPCNKNVVAAIKAVAEKLGNRPATCKKYYIHPAVFELYNSGGLAPYLNAKPKRPGGLTAVESCVLEILRDSAQRASTHPKTLVAQLRRPIAEARAQATNAS